MLENVGLQRAEGGAMNPSIELTITRLVILAVLAWCAVKVVAHLTT